MNDKKIGVTIAIDSNIVSKGKKIARLISFSRCVEYLVLLNIQLIKSFSEPLEGKR